MITAIIISGILVIFIIGFVQVYNRHNRFVKKIDFAGEYRNKFVEFANKYFKNYDRWSRSGNFDGEQYVWLTMNVSRIQNYLGTFGIMDYIAPFQTYKVSNYQIVINTLPKFRDGSIQDFDVTSVDDCMLRYIGHLEEYQKDTQRNLRNPIIWFREGFREILSIPIFILSWFGIISNRTLNSIKDSLIYKVISGLIALVTLVSGIVTIIVGYEQTLKFINKIVGNE
ncbi:hypothetical protein [Algoriphagus sediminis]|uniref:Uncharacterized protein n=1 Tax=Algoriphagus sediminis TaxID=3057113 RepID=A0ABT7YCS3_9BACT|nr:hypothetical protein [Algoriphagus sediminis]MDN3204320.1 hypothetical protein [Algoriphagus sediminis]